MFRFHCFKTCEATAWMNWSLKGLSYKKSTSSALYSLSKGMSDKCDWVVGKSRPTRYDSDRADARTRVNKHPDKLSLGKNP